MSDSRRPVHLAVLVGASASVYAISLAGVTALQSATDARLIAERAPADHAADVMARGHDELEDSTRRRDPDLRHGRGAVCAARPTAGRHGDVARCVREAGPEGHRRRERPARPSESPDDPRVDDDPDRHEDQDRPRDDGSVRLTALGPGIGREAGAATAPDGTGERVFRFEARAMASPLRLTVVDDGARDADRAAEGAWAEVIDEFEASEQAMSRFRDTSDLMRLDREAGTGRPVTVPRRLERALVAADRAHRVTGGRFDPRLARALDRLGYAGAALGPPTRAEDGATTGPVAAVASSDGPVVRRAGRGRMTVERPVDLGGIGKGLALRWAAARAEARGIGPYLLEAGGDLVVRGPGPGDAPWLVGIEDPAGGEALAAIAVGTGAVATSSVRIRSWVHEGRAVHHLLDPADRRTGRGRTPGRDRARSGSRLGRGLVEDAVHRRAPADHGRRASARVRRLVGHRRGRSRDDVGGPSRHGLGRGRDLATP